VDGLHRTARLDVYLVDVRARRSTRPPEMDQQRNNPPIVTTDVAVKDVGSAIDLSSSGEVCRSQSPGLVGGLVYHRLLFTRTTNYSRLPLVSMRRNV